MKNLMVLCLPLFMASYNCMAITTDSVKVTPNMIAYASDFEKKNFQQLHEKGVFDSIGFLFCLDTTTTDAKARELEKKLNDFFDSKLASAVNKKSPEKTLKNIFREIHDNLLTKYVRISHFEKLLDVGEYNCVTATALYAMAFDRFGIPYQLRSTTDHVYIIANPGAGQTVIEATDPQNGVFQYSEPYKKQYVEMLMKQKMISKTEYNSTSIDALFQQHYLKSDTVGWRELISYHYYNNGIELTTEEKFEDAINQYMKALYLNPSQQVKYMLYLTLASTLNKHFDITDTTDLQRYFLMHRLVKDEGDLDFLYSKYAYAIDELCMRNEDLPLYEKISQQIFTNVSDSAFLAKTQQLYHYGYFINYALKEDIFKAYHHAIISYCLNPKNLVIKKTFDKLFTAGIHDILWMEDEEMDSLLGIIKTAEKACDKTIGTKIRMEIELLQAARLFDDNDEKGGEEILSRIEKEAEAANLHDFDDEFVDRAYTNAYKRFFLKHNITKSKEIIGRGLKLDPDNKELTDRLKLMDTYKDNEKPYQFIPPPPPPPSSKSGNSTPRTVIVKPGGK